MLSSVGQPFFISMLEVSIASFSYPKNDTNVLTDIQFSVKQGDHLVVLGESGCGKSTLLHLIYGLLPLEKGNIIFEGKPLLGPDNTLIPGEDFMKLVAQELNVMPYTTVEENIAEHLTRNHPEEENNIISELLAVVDLEDYRKTKVKSLSGGQKQGVALAKALAKTPKILLLDEPFSSIDTFRKNDLRRRLFHYLKQNNISCITATHDAEEALMFADTILMLRNGYGERYDSPSTLFNTLENEHQAGFFGEVTKLSTPDGAVEILLPHQLSVSTSNTDLQVIVQHCYFKGTHYLIQAKFENSEVFFNHTSLLKKGEKVYLSIKS